MQILYVHNVELASIRPLVPVVTKYKLSHFDIPGCEGACIDMSIARIILFNDQRSLRARNRSKTDHRILHQNLACTGRSHQKLCVDCPILFATTSLR